MKAKKEKVIDLSTFLKQHPNIEATVRMGTYSLGHSKTTKVTGAAALKQAVNSFIKKYVDVRGDEVSVIRDGDRMDIVLYPGDGDPESDQIGSFTIHSEGKLIKEGVEVDQSLVRKVMDVIENDFFDTDEEDVGTVDDIDSWANSVLNSPKVSKLTKNLPADVVGPTMDAIDTKLKQFSKEAKQRL